jgi:hypothetical protein
LFAKRLYHACNHVRGALRGPVVFRREDRIVLPVHVDKEGAVVLIALRVRRVDLNGNRARQHAGIHRVEGGDNPAPRGGGGPKLDANLFGAHVEDEAHLGLLIVALFVHPHVGEPPTKAALLDADRLLLVSIPEVPQVAVRAIGVEDATPGGAVPKPECALGVDRLFHVREPPVEGAQPGEDVVEFFCKVAAHPVCVSLGEWADSAGPP